MILEFQLLNFVYFLIFKIYSSLPAKGNPGKVNAKS